MFHEWKNIKDAVPIIATLRKRGFAAKLEVVPVSVGAAIPASTGAAVPESVGSVVPESVGPAVPESVGPAVPESVGPAVLESVGPAVPESIGPAVPESVVLAVPAGFGPAASMSASEHRASSSEHRGSRPRERRVSRPRERRASRARERRASRTRERRASRTRERRASRTREHRASRTRERRASRSRGLRASRLHEHWNSSTGSSSDGEASRSPSRAKQGCRTCAMAECSFARCQQERRAIRKELQRWTKNMVYILGLERVAEELMGRRKWKLYQDALISKRGEGERSSDEESVHTDPPPALKIKTIEQINEDEGKDERIDRTERPEEKPRRPETILETLIKRPATQPKVELSEEPLDWKPQDKCYFCTDGEPGQEVRAPGTTSPASESDSSSVSGAKSPASAPPLLQHLLQLQAQNPQTIAQFQQMITALAALGSGLVPPPPLSQAWMMQRMVQRQQADRLPDIVEKAPASSSPIQGEQPLDLSNKSTSSTSGTPPPDTKLFDNRLKRTALDLAGCNSAPRRAYTEEELLSAVRDIQTGRLGTRRAALLYNIPRSTLRNKLNKFGAAPENIDSEPDSDERPESPHSVILKIPTFPPPDDKSPSPAGVQLSASTTVPITPVAPPPQPPLLLPHSMFADPPSTQHLFTSISDVIAKSISQKFQQPLDRLHHQPTDLPFLRAPDRHVSVIKTPPDNQRYVAPGNSKATTNNNGQAATGGKGTRPKRGKYRNYDRDSLVEAVKAVQRGEMSVHRAGSYYGVPHSTLEYKVKERHLMRPRKREPKPPQDNKPQPPKPPPPKPPTKPFSNGMNGPDTPGYPPGYPYWGGGGFAPPPAPDLYASHMMRRLREEAPPPANGSFLEGIIRSSLERPALLQRLTSDPRGGEATPGLLRRLTGEDEPPVRRQRLDSSDQALAAEMREAVQRLRADKLRPRNGTPTPPPGAGPSPLPAVSPSPAPAPPDRA